MAGSARRGTRSVLRVGLLLGSFVVRARLPASVSFLAALLLALNVVCLCPHAAAAAERGSAASAAAAAGHCAGGHETPSAPTPQESRCPHCDEIGARLAQSGAERGLGTQASALGPMIAPALAQLRFAAPERAATLSAPNGGFAPPAALLRTIVLQI